MNETTDGFFMVDTPNGKALVKASAVTAVVSEKTVDANNNEITGCFLHLQGTYIQSNEKTDNVSNRWQRALQPNIKDLRA